jgi:pilus assembly protein Flp/PilA
MLYRLLKEEEGQTLVEYALILAIIAIAVIAAMTLLRGQISTVLNSVTGTLANEV